MRRWMCRAVAILALFPFSLVRTAECAVWTVKVDEQNGLPTISVGGAPILTSQFVFWGKNYSWSDFPTQFKVAAPFTYAVTGQNQTLKFNLLANVRRPSTRQFSWQFEFDAQATSADVIGGGISFNLQVQGLGSQLGDPELLPGNRGWRWGKGARALELQFDPPLPAVFFERGQKSEIRAYFYSGEVPQGKQRYTARLSIPEDMQVGATSAEKFGLDDPKTWPTSILNSPIAPWNVSPVDLSFLNAREKPAGKRGFLKVQGDKLLFEDGTPARFWGTNLVAWALFATDRENAKRQAHRLSELGFNLVRLHHHDSFWVAPNIFGDTKQPDTKHLSAAMLDRLDWWIACLKEEGIYVWLDLHVQRHFKAADQIADFDEFRRGQPTADLKGFNYVNPSIQLAMKEFNEAYVGHVNPFTGLAYKDDPSIVAMLLTNENDVTHHFGNALLPDKNVPKHNAIYMAEAAAFAERNKLSKELTWRSWQFGPSKIFLNDLEQRFNAMMIDHLRSLGVKSAIATTNSWGWDPLISLPALTSGNLIDVHSYGGPGELEKNPLFAPNSVHWLAAAQVVDFPLTVTEWNVGAFPIPDRHTLPLYVAASAAFQGWDALMHFAYAQQPLTNRGAPGAWEAFNDPGQIATLPAAALLFRRHDVAEARTTYVFAPGRDQFFGQSISPATSVALRTAPEIGKLVIAMPATPALPWLKESRIPAGATVITDPRTALITADATEAVSDTGQLRRNWEQGVYTINSPRTQAAMGWIGGRQIELADVQIAMSTPNATVAVQSLSDAPISESKELMISLGARSVPTGGNQMPFHSEPVIGRISIQAPHGMKLYKRVGSTTQTIDQPMSYVNGRYSIQLERDLGSYWLFMKSN